MIRLDIRLMDEEVAARIKKMKRTTKWRFAYDSLDYGHKVKDGLEILNNARIPTRHNTMFYVYVDGDADFYNALKRCNDLKEWGATPYVMINGNASRTPRMTALKDWCRPWSFWKCEFKDYARWVRLKKQERSIEKIEPLEAYV